MADQPAKPRRRRSKAVDGPKRRGGIARKGSGASNQMGKRAGKQILPLFVQHYLGDCRHNATAAALAVGANERSAHQVGYKWLQEARQNGMLALAAQRTALDAELSTRDILLELKRVALNDPRRFFRSNGELKPPDEWDDDMAAAVSQIEAIPKVLDGHADDQLDAQPHGGALARKRNPTIGYTYKLKFWSKVEALDKAMRHQGLFEKDNAQKQENLAIQVILMDGPEPKPNGHANGNGAVTIEAELIGEK